MENNNYLAIKLSILTIVIFFCSLWITSTVTSSIEKINNRTKVKVTLYAIPDNMSLKIGNSDFTDKIGKSFYLEPGKYKLSGSSDGFSHNETVVNVPETNEFNMVIGLNPISEQANAWMKNNQNKIRLAATAMGNSSSSKQTPELIKKLPIANVFYGLSLMMDQDNDFYTIKISGTDPLSRAMAVNVINKTDESYNYKYVYESFKNPLIKENK